MKRKRRYVPCPFCGRMFADARYSSFARLKAECRECYLDKRAWLMYWRRPRCWRERIMRESARRAAKRPTNEALAEAKEDLKLWQ